MSHLFASIQLALLAATANSMSLTAASSPTPAEQAWSGVTDYMNDMESSIFDVREEMDKNIDLLKK